MQDNTSAVFDSTTQGSRHASDDEPVRPITLASASYILTEFVLGLMSAIINFLVLLAIYRERHLRTISNCFVGSLAAVDMCVGLVVVPIFIFANTATFNNFYLYLFAGSLVDIFSNISVLCLLTVALERFLAIHIPFHYRRLMTIDMAMSVVLATWATGLLTGFLPLIASRIEFRKGHLHVGRLHEHETLSYATYLRFFLVFLPTLITVCIVYTYIFVVVQRTKAVLRALEVRQNYGPQRLRRTRQARRLFLMPACMILCKCPFQVVELISRFNGEGYLPEYVPRIALVLDHAESVLNPFLYAFDNTQIQLATIKIVFNKLVTYIPNEADTRRRQPRPHPAPSPMKTQNKEIRTNTVLSDLTLDSLHGRSIGEELCVDALVQRMMSIQGLLKLDKQSESNMKVFTRSGSENGASRTSVIIDQTLTSGLEKYLSTVPSSSQEEEIDKATVQTQTTKQEECLVQVQSSSPEKKIDMTVVQTQTTKQEECLSQVQSSSREGKIDMTLVQTPTSNAKSATRPIQFSSRNSSQI